MLFLIKVTTVGIQKVDSIRRDIYGVTAVFSDLCMEQISVTLFTEM